jgi:outer membrane receptor protein involved in Fe transport
MATVVVAAAGLSAPLSGLAQTIEEITVTARKTEESLQDVPISISAFTGEQMRERGINNNYDVAAFTPNFTTSKRVGRDLDRPTIRGMANPGARGEPNASYFIDGTFVASTISTATTQSMERVEVLRGPQSAQFGRATFSGAVNYVTRKPSNDWESELNVRYGTHDDRMLGGWLSGPIIEDNLLILLSASYEEYGGQWNNELEANSAFVSGDTLTHVFDGQNMEADYSPLGEEQTTDLMGKLTWMPFEPTEFNFKYSFTRGDDGHYPNNRFDTLNCFIPDDPTEPWFTTSHGEFCGEFRIDGTHNVKNLPDIRNGMSVTPVQGTLPPEETVTPGVPPGTRRDINRVAADWIQDYGEWQSILTGSWSRDELETAYDLDHSEVRAVWGLFAFNNRKNIDDWSVEFAVTSPVDAPIRGKLGVYYYDQELEFFQRSYTGPFAVFGSPPGTAYDAPREQLLTNSSVFGSLSFDLAENWTLDVEARWAKDEKTIIGGQRSEVTSEPWAVEDSLEFTNFTPRFTLNWKPTDEMLVYGLIAKGNKPGGFNEEYWRNDVPSEYSNFLVNCEIGDEIFFPGDTGLVECTEEFKGKAQYSEEEQWTYEIGIKSQWFERRVTANISAFYIDWTNQGLFALDAVPQRGTGGSTPITVLENAGKSEIIGFEIESNFMPTDGLLLFFNYGYNKGEFKEGTFPELASTTGGDGDLTGNTIPDSPEHSAVFGFDASAQASASLEAFLRADFLYETKRYNGASNFNWLGDRKIANVRMGFRSDVWSATFYVKNLTNDDTPLSAFNFVNFSLDPVNGGQPLMYALNPQPSRDLGLEFQYRFGL